MKRLNLVVLGLLAILSAMPAHAYADPSGGTLFQILMPTLAALWAMWMILANRIRNTMKSLYRRLLGAQSPETTE